jgi:hypothetical protein
MRFLFLGVSVGFADKNEVGAAKPALAAAPITVKNSLLFI